MVAPRPTDAVAVKRSGGRISSHSWALFASLMAYDPSVQNLGNGLAGALASRWFGTDQLGRDILWRVIAAASTPTCGIRPVSPPRSRRSSWAWPSGWSAGTPRGGSTG